MAISIKEAFQVDFFEPGTTSSLWLPPFSSTTGESLASFCLPVLPLPQPAGVCRNQKEGMCLTQLPEILYLHPLSGSYVFIRPKNGTHPAHQAPGSLGRLPCLK